MPGEPLALLSDKRAWRSVGDIMLSLRFQSSSACKVSRLLLAWPSLLRELVVEPSSEERSKDRAGDW